MASIQGIYIALFGRPADPAGLAFFNQVTKNGTDLSAIGDLTSTREYLDTFAGQTPTQIVNTIYRALFNHDPDPAGLSFWTNALATGSLSLKNLAIAVMDGAKGSDLTILNNKIAAADAYTAALDTQSEIGAYQGNAAAAAGRAFLASVTDSVPTKSAIDSSVSTMTSAATATTTNTDDGSTNNGGGTPVVKGLSIILQTGPDDAKGETTDDRISGGVNTDIGGVSTLESTDSVDGGAGFDTLEARIFALGPNGTVVSPTLTGVEKVVATNLAGTQQFNFDAVSSTGLEQVWSKDSASGSATLYSKLDPTVVAGLDNARGTLSLNYTDEKGRAQSQTDVLRLSVNNGSDAVLSALMPDGLNTDGGFEKLVISANGAASTLRYLLNDSTGFGPGEITVSGTASANAEGYGLTLVDNARFPIGGTLTLSKVDASGMTGSGGINFRADAISHLSFSFTGSDAADKLRINPLALHVNAVNNNATFSIHGGAGTDTLALGAQNAPGQKLDLNAISLAKFFAMFNNASNHSGFEKIEFVATGGIRSYLAKADDFLNFDDFRFVADDAKSAAGVAFNISGVTFNHTYTVGSSLGGGAPISGNVSTDALTFTGASGFAQDLKLKLIGGITVQGHAGYSPSSGTGMDGGSAIDFGGNIGKLVIESTGASPNQLIGGTGGTGAGSSVGGKGGAAINNGTGFQAVEIKGSQSLTIAPGNDGVKINPNITTPGGFSDSASVDASGFTGNLNISLSLSNDTIGGGSGNDLIRGLTGADQMTGGAGDDVFVFENLPESRNASIDKTNATPVHIDHIKDFTGNGDAPGDSFQFGTATKAMAMDGVVFDAGANAVVRTANVSNVNMLDDLFTLLTNQNIGVGSTAGTAQFYDVTVSGGSMAGRFLILQDSVDAFTFSPGVLGGGDLLIQLTGATGALHAKDFVFSGPAAI